MKCADCAKWNEWKGHTPRIGFCQRTVELGFTPMAWPDGACPAFEARKDWAQEVTEKLFDHTTEFWKRDDIAELIRAAAKAHYEGGQSCEPK